MEIPLSRPDVTRREIDAVVDVLQSDRLSIGPKVTEFEQQLATYCGTKHGIACCNGTAGLHLLIRALGVGPGDEVITTPFSFISSANCILFENAKPVFVDVDPETWNLDPRRIESAVTRKTKVILAVDVFGQVADFEPIRRVAGKHGLRVIEDSCEAIGGTYKGRRAGSLGDAGVFGFYPNKQITTGEGGMIVTDDDGLAAHLRSLRNQGRGEGGGWLAHERLGYNFRLADVNCAIGIVQLERIDEILTARARVARWYLQRFADEPRLRVQKVHPDVKMSWFVMVVRLSDDYDHAARDRILAGLRDKNIGCNNYFVPIHLQPFYREQFGHKEGDFPICEALAARTIALPFHNRLTETEVDAVCTALRQLL